jgi:hypothetical protein
MILPRVNVPTVLAVLLTLLPSLAFADGIDGVYRGTLGTQEIVLLISAQEITFRDSTGAEESYAVQGRYFYHRYGQEITLAGSRLEDGSIRIEEFPNGHASGAEWRLTISGDKATGVFCKCDVRQPASPSAKPLNISLKRIASSDAQQAYNDLLLTSIPLKTGTEVQVNDQVAYVMQTDPRSKASMVHLTRFPHAAVMAHVNKDLSE